MFYFDTPASCVWCSVLLSLSHVFPRCCRSARLCHHGQSTPHLSLCWQKEEPAPAAPSVSFGSLIKEEPALPTPSEPTAPPGFDLRAAKRSSGWIRRTFSLVLFSEPEKIKTGALNLTELFVPESVGLSFLMNHVMFSEQELSLYFVLSVLTKAEVSCLFLRHLFQAFTVWGLTSVWLRWHNQRSEKVFSTSKPAKSKTEVFVPETVDMDKVCSRTSWK